jgi:hypothetical protein
MFIEPEGEYLKNIPTAGYRFHSRGVAQSQSFWKWLIAAHSVAGLE